MIDFSYLSNTHKVIDKLSYEFEKTNSAKLLESLNSRQFNKSISQASIALKINKFANEIVEEAINCSYFDGINSLKTSDALLFFLLASSSSLFLVFGLNRNTNVSVCSVHGNSPIVSFIIISQII